MSKQISEAEMLAILKKTVEACNYQANLSELITAYPISFLKKAKKLFK